MDVESLTAIDVHTHAEVGADGRLSLSPELMGASAAYFQAHGRRQPTIDDTARHYAYLRQFLDLAPSFLAVPGVITQFLNEIDAAAPAEGRARLTIRGIERREPPVDHGDDHTTRARL